MLNDNFKVECTSFVIVTSGLSAFFFIHVEACIISVCPYTEHVNRMLQSKEKHRFKCILHIYKYSCKIISQEQQVDCKKLSKYFPISLISFILVISIKQ